MNPAPHPAAALLKAAETRAETGGNNVLVLVHASWCGWCKRLERYLQEPDVRRRPGASYEVVGLGALERPAAGALTSPRRASAVASATSRPAAVAGLTPIQA